MASTIAWSPCIATIPVPLSPFRMLNNWFWTLFLPWPRPVCFQDRFCGHKPIFPNRNLNCWDGFEDSYFKHFLALPCRTGSFSSITGSEISMRCADPEWTSSFRFINIFFKKPLETRWINVAPSIPCLIVAQCCAPAVNMQMFGGQLLGWQTAGLKLLLFALHSQKLPLFLWHSHKTVPSPNPVPTQWWQCPTPLWSCQHPRHCCTRASLWRSRWHAAQAHVACPLRCSSWQDPLWCRHRQPVGKKAFFSKISKIRGL